MRLLLKLNYWFPTSNSKSLSLGKAKIYKENNIQTCTISIGKQQNNFAGNLILVKIKKIKLIWNIGEQVGNGFSIMSAPNCLS